MNAVVETPAAAPQGLAVVIIGAGNIGSHLLHLIGRIPPIARVTIVDRDAYEDSNLRSQAINPADIGRPKAAVMARALKRINPALEVEAFADAVENVPLGRLRGHAWLTGLDSRAARLVVNEYAMHLGVPVWLDAGVEPTARLARVSIFTPGAASACIECHWSADDYRDVSQSYACDGSSIAAAPTNGSASLGALAAAQQALECQAAIESGLRPALAGHEILIDAASHKSYVSQLRRNPECRCDHDVWQIDRLPPGCRSLGDLTALAEDRGCAPRLRVEGHAFASDIHCRGCGRGAALTLMSSRASRLELRCRSCGERTAVDFHAASDEIDLAALPASLRRASLRSVGLRTGEVISLGGVADARHFEIGDSVAAQGAKSNGSHT